MSSNLVKRSLSLLPLSPIITFWGIGKAEHVREVWISLATALYGLLILLITGIIGSSSLHWGATTLFSFIATFAVGLAACIISEFRKDYNSDEVVIDKVAGLLLTLFLVMPLLTYAHAYFYGFIFQVCLGVFTCGSGFSNFVAFAIVTPIAFTAYFMFDNWDVWPRLFLEHYFNNSFGMFIYNIFLAIYVASLLYLVFFLPLKLPFDQVYLYFIHSFKNTGTLLSDFLPII